MSASDPVASVSVVRRPNPIPGAKSWQPGQSGNPGGVTKAERKFRAAVDDEFFPEAIEILRDMLAVSRDPEIGDDVRQKARMDFMKCIGAIRKPSDEATIQALAKQLLEGMLDEARSRREAAATTPAVESKP